ncbi:MAG: hypothetical protein ACI8UR_000908 [Natronomonas sp.]|jgi:hypothetical protein
MFYECTECGLVDRGPLDAQPTVRQCPDCEEQTRWTPAFEGAPQS